MESLRNFFPSDLFKIGSFQEDSPSHSTITRSTIARALSTPEGMNPLEYGTDYTHDLLKFQPITENGRKEWEAQKIGKKEPLAVVLRQLAEAFDEEKPYSKKMHRIAWQDFNQFIIVGISINNAPRTLRFIPSVLTNSIDLLIEGEAGSDNIDTTMGKLIKNFSDWRWYYLNNQGSRNDQDNRPTIPVYQSLAVPTFESEAKPGAEDINSTIEKEKERRRLDQIEKEKKQRRLEQSEDQSEDTTFLKFSDSDSSDS